MLGWDGVTGEEAKWVAMGGGYDGADEIGEEGDQIDELELSASKDPDSDCYHSTKEKKR